MSVRARRGLGAWQGMPRTTGSCADGTSNVIVGTATPSRVLSLPNGREC